MSSRRLARGRRPLAAADGHREESPPPHSSAEAELLEGRGGNGGEQSTVGENLQHIATALAPGTLIGALMYYFGWVRTHSFYRYFGIDADNLGFSAVDYILRSATVLWPPLIGASLSVFVAQLGLAFWDRHVTRTTRAGRLRLTVILPMYILAVALVAISGYRALFASAPLTFGTPLYLAGGFTVVAYARTMSRLLYDRTGKGRPATSPASQTEMVSLRALLTIVALALFWTAALFADSLGRDVARHLESTNFAATPDILLYSRDRVHFIGGGVEEQDLGLAYSPYRFRYEGLKLLRGGDNYVIVPYSWSTTNAIAVILPNDKDVRIVFSPAF